MDTERKGILEVLTGIFPNKSINIDDTDSFIDNLGMDSITFVSYVIGIEEKFAIDVPDEYSLPSKLDSIKKTLDLLQKERCKTEKNKKIRLSIMPFWSPLTPPLGIACLKSYLEQYGYEVNTKDYNTISPLFDFGSRYISLLKSYTPRDKMGNIAMVGYDVLALHLIAYNNRENMDDYYSLIHKLIYENFFYEASHITIKSLCDLIDDFYETFTKYLMKDLEKCDFDVYGISCYSLTLGPSIFTFKLIKKYFPNVITVMGGGIFADQLNPYSKEFKKFVEQTPYIDYFLIGEGETIFLKLLRSNFDNMPRVIVCDNTIERISLDNAPLPDFSDFDINSYPQLVAYSSRSCPFQCSFCSETIQWGRYRQKKCDKFISELYTLVEKYRKKIIVFADSLLNPNIDFIADLLSNGSEKVPFYWDTYLRVCDMTDDIYKVKKWRKAGLYRVRLGIESGSQNVLNMMDKKITVEQIKSNIKNLARVGIKVSTFWVIGFPGETEEDFMESLKLIRELKDDLYEVDPHPFYFYPKGQVESENWEFHYGYQSIYPEKYNDMLMCSYYKLNREPYREEIYSRLEKFKECCEECNIPNPYSLMDIYHADKRWKKLHPSSVPIMHDLINADKDFEDIYREKLILKEDV